MQNKKLKIFSTVLTIVISTMLVAGVVMAATTIGTNIATAGDITVNTDKFVVTGSSGNTAIDGTLAVDGSVTLGDAVTDVVTANGYFTQLRIGTGSTFANIAAVGADELGVEGAAEIDGAAYLNGDITAGNAVTDTLILNGRMSTSSVAGAALALGSTYAYPQLWEIRGTISDWATINDNFTGAYFRFASEADSATSGTKNLKGMEVNISSTNSTGSLQGLYVETQYKTVAATETIGTLQGIESNLSLYNQTSTANLTTWGTPFYGTIGLGSGYAAGDFLKLHGMVIETRGGITGTLGYGLYMLNKVGEGTQTWTKGIYMNMAAVTGIDLAGAMTTGIDISGASTTDIKLQNDETISNAINGTIAFVSDAGTITGEQHGIDLTYTGTLSAGDNMVGINSVVTPAGTGGTWVSGVYGKVIQGATKNVAGYISGGEFEVADTNAAPSEVHTLVLDANSTVFDANSSYIWGQTFGGADMPNLLKLTGLASGTGNMWYGPTLRMKIGDSTVASRYLIMSETENKLDLGNGSGGISVGTATTGISLPGTYTTGLSITNAKVTQGYTSTSATGGQDAFTLTLTDSQAQTSGMTRGLVVAHNVSGAKSGTADSEGINVDMTLSGNTNDTFGTGVYVVDSGNKTHGGVFGSQVYMADMGTNTVSTIVGSYIGLESTHLATGRHTALRLVNHTGTAKSAILLEGNWTTGIDLSGVGGGGTQTAVGTDIRLSNSTTIASGDSRPATCVKGSLFMNTTTGTLNVCLATNDWATVTVTND